MGVKSLVEICTKVALENISRIDSVQNMPAKIAQDILAGVRSAAQLRKLEENDDELGDATAPHWRRLIRRDFAILEKQYNWVPKRHEEWHKVYKKYADTRDQQDAEATAKLEAAFAARKKQADSRHAALVTVKDTWKLPRLPKDGGSSSGGARPPHWSTSSTSSTGGGSSSRPKDGKGFLQQARREARVIQSRHAYAVSAARPTVTSNLSRAPTAMVEAKRIERQYDPTAAHKNAPTIRVPRAMTTRVDPDDRERKEREARLLSIKNGGNRPSGNVISFDDDDEAEEEEDEEEEEEEEDGDDIFGDTKISRRLATERNPSSSPESAFETPKKSTLKRRHGLLSASPGANVSSRTVHITKRAVPDPSPALSRAPPTSPPKNSPRMTPSSSQSFSRSVASARNNKSANTKTLADEPTSSALSSTDRAAVERMKRKASSVNAFLPSKNKRPRT